MISSNMHFAYHLSFLTFSYCSHLLLADDSVQAIILAKYYLFEKFTYALNYS